MWISVKQQGQQQQNSKANAVWVFFFFFFIFGHIFSCFYRKHMLFFYFPANFPHELPLCFQSMRSDWLNKQSFLCAMIGQTQALCGCVFICSSQCISTDTSCVSAGAHRCVKRIKKCLWGYFPQLPHKVLLTFSSLKSADEKNKRWGLLGLQNLWSTFHTWKPSSFSDVQ